jgi:hypothetical protein
MDLDSDDFFDPRIRNVSLGRPDVDRGHGPENQRSLYRGKSSPKLDGNRSEPKHVLWQRSHTCKYIVFYRIHSVWVSVFHWKRSIGLHVVRCFFLFLRKLHSFRIFWTLSHLKFCNLLLHLKSSTPSYMIYGELGRYPLEIDIKSRIISLCAIKLLPGKELKLSKIIYNLCYCMSIKNVEHFTWLDNVTAFYVYFQRISPKFTIYHIWWCRWF